MRPAEPGRQSGIAGRLADLAMGFRFAFAGGAEGWLRAGMTAVGVGLGVALLLVAVSIPHMLDARADRTSAMAIPIFDMVEAKADNTMLVVESSTDYRQDTISGLILQPEGPDAPVPPGVERLPAPGEMIVSPELAELLSSPEGELLRPRLDYPIVGTIAPEGLTGPGTYRYYLGSDTLTAEQARRIDHIGVEADPEPLHPMLIMMVLIGIIVLLLPVAMFVAVAVRFGGERRDRRLAALRLVGADQQMTRRMAGGEALAGSILGLVLGAVFFLIGRQFIEGITLWEISVFSFDVVPNPVLAGLIVVLVPTLAVVVTIMAMRRLLVEPLGVVRQAAEVRRRLWWRLLLPVVGLALMYPLIAGSEFDGEQVQQITVSAGVVLLLLGVAALLPWLVEFTVMRFRGGSVPWQLATRRLQQNGGSAGRVVNGIAVAAAGGIALQMLFSGIQGQFVGTTGVQADIPQLSVTASVDEMPMAEMVAELSQVEGVSVRNTFSTLDATIGDGDEFTHYDILVISCDQLRKLSDVTECADGDTFVNDTGYPVPASGEALTFFNPNGTETVDPLVWTVPDSRGDVEMSTGYMRTFYGGLVITPGAIDASAMEFASDEVQLNRDPDNPDATEYVRNLAAEHGMEWTVTVLDPISEDPKFASLRNALLAGVAATMILIGLSLLVSTLEQLQERRRVLSVLVAFGVRRRTLTWSVLWQTAVPVSLGLLLAILTGVVLGGVLLQMVGGAISVDWGNIATITGIGGALVLAVTFLSFPVLWRLMRADGIRTE